VASDPAHPNVVWAVGLGGLNRSDDHGATFRPVPVSVPGRFPGDPLLQVVAAAGGVFVTDRGFNAFWSGDGGRTWTRSAAGGDTPIARSPADPATVVAIKARADARLRRMPARGRAARLICFVQGVAAVVRPPVPTISHDGGRTWSDLPQPPTTLPAVDVVITAGGALIVTVLDFDDLEHPSRVYRTTDLGGHWTVVTPPWPPDQRVIADATVPNRLWRHAISEAPGGLASHLLRSDDLGSTWSDVGDAPGQRVISTATGLVDLALPDTCGRVFAPRTESGDGVFRSGDAGMTFSSDAAGLPEEAGAAAYDRAGTSEVLATGYGVFHRDGPGAWRASRTPLGPAVVRDLVDDGPRLVAGTPDGAYVSTDRTHRWTPIVGLPAHADVADLAAARGRVAVVVERPNVALYEGPSGGRVARVRGLPAASVIAGLAYERSGTLIVATRARRLYRVHHGRLFRVHRFGRAVTALAVDARGRIRVIVAGTGTTLMTSADRGRTFTARPLPSAFTPPRIYPAGDGYYIDDLPRPAFSPDGHKVRLAAGLFDFPGSHARIAALAAHPRVAWVATFLGVLRTHDGGRHLQGLPFAQLAQATAVLVHGRDLVYATAEHGVRRRRLFVGDLSRPSMTVRLNRRTRVITGVVHDRDVRGASVAFEVTCPNDESEDDAEVGPGGRFQIRIDLSDFDAPCRRPHVTVTAIDAAGNASGAARFTLG
jgi:photosystem II stability/assembly factor-like uncharacterized protein